MQTHQRIGWAGKLLVMGFSLGVLSLPAVADTLTWNGGVAGVWQSGSGGWLSGGAAANWNSATPDDAVFGGLSAGSLTVDAGGVTVGDVSVTNGTYSIDAGGTLTLSSTAFFVDTALTTTVSAALGGSSGLLKTGGGTLIFTNTTKNYSGATVVSGGAVRISTVAAGSLGLTATQQVQLAGGALHALFAANLTVSNFIEVGAAGGELRNLGGDGGRWGMAPNRISGSGTLTIAFGSANTRFQMLGSQNAFTGKWVLDSGGNQNRLVDIFSSSALGGATGADAFSLLNSASLALRPGVTLGSSTQGLYLGAGQTKILVTGGSTAVLAGAMSGPVTNTLRLDTENSTSLLIVSNTANSWLGETTIAGPGVVRLGTAGVLPDDGGNVSINSGSTLDVNGNEEAIGGLFGAGRLDNRAAGAPVILTTGGNNNSPTFSGILTNSGADSPFSLVKVGTGIQTFSGTNTFGGFVRVEAGTLALSSAADLAAATAVTVNAGATILTIARTDGALNVVAGQVLAGAGTIIGLVSNLGAVAPVGTLTITGSYVQGASGTLRLELAGASSYDRLRATGAGTLSGLLDVSLDSFSPAASDTFTLASFASRSGTFASTNLPSLSAGLGWLVQYSSTSVVLVVTGAPPVTGYDAWAGAITNGLTNFNESATGDGYPNLLKYATGSSPTNSDALAKLDATRSGGALSLHFNRNTNAVDITYVVEGSDSVANGAVWSGVATNRNGAWSPPGVSETGSGSPVNVTVVDNVITSVTRYLRLQVARPRP